MPRDKPVKLRRIKQRCKTLEEAIKNTEIALDYLAFGKKLPSNDSAGAYFFIFIDDNRVAIEGMAWSGWASICEAGWKADYQKLCAYFEPQGYQLSHAKREKPDRYNRTKKHVRITTFIKPGR